MGEQWQGSMVHNASRSMVSTMRRDQWLKFASGIRASTILPALIHNTHEVSNVELLDQTTILSPWINGPCSLRALSFKVFETYNLPITRSVELVNLQRAQIYGPRSSATEDRDYLRDFGLREFRKTNAHKPSEYRTPKW